MTAARKVKSSGNKRGSAPAAPKAAKATPAATRTKKPASPAVASGRADASAARDKGAVSASSAASRTKPTSAALTKADQSKLMRDTFRMPRADFDLLRALKARAKALGHPAKKSALLRAGLHALQSHSDDQLRAALRSGIAPVAARTGSKPSARQK